MKRTAKQLKEALKKKIKRTKRKVQKKENKKTEVSPIQPNLSKMRDDECIPIVVELFKIIANAEGLVIGSTETITEAQATTYYRELYESKIAPLLVEKNIKISDMPFIWQLMNQVIGFIQQISDNTIDKRYDQAVAKLMKVDEVKDVRISNIQGVLVEKPDTKK